MIKNKVKTLGILKIDISKIAANPQQPRVIFDKGKLKELAENIDNNGLLQPIVIRKLENKYVIIAGERRFRAHKLLKREKIKAKVIKCSDKIAYELTLLENIQREDLSLLEEARGYKHLMQQFGYKLKELSKVTSKSTPSICNILGVLKEDERVQKYVDSGILTLAALVHLKRLPNLNEKLQLLRKLESEEIKRSNVREYVKRICDAYEIAEKMGIKPEDVLKQKRKNKGGKYDQSSEFVKDYLNFYFIGDYGLNSSDLEFLPTKNLLYSAFTIMYNKGVSKQFAKVLLNREKIQRLFMDCGAFTCMKHKQWSFYDKIDELINFYENIQPTICTSLDVPTFPFLFEHWRISSKKAIKKTLKNAEKFKQWKPSFETIKLYPLQGDSAKEYIECFHMYKDLGVFEEDNVAVAFGGIATTSLKNQIQWISKTTADKDFKKIREKLKFVHGFGVGNPKRIVALNKYGVDSFDAVTTIIISSTGGYWLRDGSIGHHIIHETPISRKLRFYFNANSFWGQLTERLAKAKGIELKEKKGKVDFKNIKKEK